VVALLQLVARAGQSGSLGKYTSTLSRVVLHCHEKGASARLEHDSQVYTVFIRHLHNAASKTPTVFIQYSLNNLNSKISYNIKNIKD